jgi:hypothetical protein
MDTTNEPVAWMVKTLDGKKLMLYGEKQPPKFAGDVQCIPLYEHSEKTLTDADFDNIFANGKRLGVLETEDKFRKEKTLTHEEITQVFNDCYPNNGDGDVVNLVDFARAILRKAQGD